MQIAAQHIMHASTVDALTTGAQSRVEEERVETGADRRVVWIMDQTSGDFILVERA